MGVHGCCFITVRCAQFSFFMRVFCAFFEAVFAPFLASLLYICIVVQETKFCLPRQGKKFS